MLFKPFGFYKPAVVAGPGTDPDADAFISAAGITDPTQQDAIQTLVTDLKADSLWTELIAVYPFVGGTASSHKYNLKDPQDTDAAYRLDIPGGYTNNSNGITANDTDIADTHFLPSSYWSDNLSAAMGFYSLDWPSNQQNISMGADSSGTGFNMINEPYQAPSNKYMGRAFIQLINPSTQLSTNIGLTTISRTNNTNLQFYFNDESVASNTTAEGSTSRPTNTVAIGGLNGGSQRSDQNYAFAFISEGLDGTQMSNLYSAVQAYQTTLSRQVPDIQRTNLFRWFDAEWYADSSTWTDLVDRQSATVQSVTYTSGTPDYYDFPGGSGTIGIGSIGRAHV